MPLPTELTMHMVDEVILEPAGALNRFNNFTFGAPVTVKCYIIRENKRALDRTGRETISTVQVILATPELLVTDNDRLTLPDGSQPAIIGVLGAKDDLGQPYYLEIRA